MSSAANSSDSTGSPAGAAPLVSVILPAWNCAPFVGAAVASIVAQTYTNWELVIVDDCSTDDTPAILARLAAADPRIRLFTNATNLKQTRTRNFAIGEARGALIALLDSDDERLPTCLAEQVAFLEAHPAVVGLGTASEWCDEDMNRLNDRLYPLDNATIRRTFMRYSPFCLPSMMFRASALDSPPYDATLEPAEDIDLAVRLGTRGELANLPGILYRIRTHRGSVTRRGMRVMELKTFAIRWKALREHGYSIRPADVLFNAVQFGTMYLMPAERRFWLFNKLRSRS